MATAKKAAEAARHILEAEKFLKTSLLKWKPDYELAADSYERAATCYKTSKDLPKCRDCLYKAVDCYKHTKSYPFHQHIMFELSSIFTSKNAM